MENKEYEKEREQLLKFKIKDWISLILFIFFGITTFGWISDIVSGIANFQTWVSLIIAVIGLSYSIVSGIFLFLKKIKKLRQLKQKYGIGV